MEAVGPLTQALWARTSKIYEELLTCEFVVGLANGNLSEKAFNHYLSQDVIYIQKDAESLARISERATNETESHFFKRMSSDCIEIEEILHNEFMDFFQVKAAKKQSPAFSQYSSFLEEKAHKADYAIAIAALLPCFWLYGKVGHHILATQSPNNKYQKFINTYSGNEYTNYTRQFISIMENQANTVDTFTWNAIIETFMESTRHELRVFQESTNI